MDADSRLKHDALEKIYRVFLRNEELPEKKRVVGGTATMHVSSIGIMDVDPRKLRFRRLRSRIFNFLYPLNLQLFHMTGKEYQFGMMFCTKEVFNHVQFNTDKAQGEDDEFLAGLKKYGKVTRIRSVCGITSDRRMIMNGYGKVLWSWTTGKGELY